MDTQIVHLLNVNCKIMQPQFPQGGGGGVMQGPSLSLYSQTQASKHALNILKDNTGFFLFFFKRRHLFSFKKLMAEQGSLFQTEKSKWRLKGITHFSIRWVALKCCDPPI